MKKNRIQWFLITMTLAFLSAGIKLDAGWWLVLKHVSLALCFFMCGYGVASLVHIPQSKHPILRTCFGCFGLLGILFFSFLSMDTFVFHTWTWYPGILRYVLFDAYGICYLVFSIFGICFYIGNGEKI